uniref:DUF1677 family protein n=1 Tax=Oryza rufipogon TaxID=4529 RepID=A0A0E0NC31_ORYRU
MAPNGEASSAVVAAVAPFLATFIGNHHLGHGGDGHGHKEMELLATTTGGGGGGGGESIPAEEQQQVVEEAECECCGMSEECTAAYAGAVRRRFSGRWVCGLCAEAVAEEAGKKKGGEREAALAAHMAAAVDPIQPDSLQKKTMLSGRFNSNEMQKISIASRKTKGLESLPRAAAPECRLSLSRHAETRLCKTSRRSSVSGCPAAKTSTYICTKDGVLQLW